MPDASLPFFSELQRKPGSGEGLAIGSPGDKYEVEAEAMADQVMRKLQYKQPEEPPFFRTVGGLPPLQAKCAECAHEEIQQKGSAGDEEELQPKLLQGGSHPEQTFIQRKCHDCEQASREDAEKEIRTKPEGPGAVDTGNTTGSFEDMLNASGAGGRSLPGNTLAEMESAFGTDFNSVRVHTDGAAIRLSRELHAEAFTHGDHIYFNRDRYDPSGDHGRHLLAHELTHVVQQNGPSRIQRRLRVERDYPDYLRNSAGNIAQQDPAFSMTSAQRFSFVNGLIGNLCPDYRVGGSDGVVTRRGRNPGPRAISDGNNPGACCCLHTLTRPTSTTDWRILISGTVSPHTFSAKQAVLEGGSPTPDQQHNSVVIPSPDAEVEYGHFTASDQRHIMSTQLILGHELCGHAALMELEAHPVSASRLDTNVHDPTVNIQNLIGREQGEQASDLRGLAAGNQHRGESFARVIARGYPINKVSVFNLPAGERAKLDFVARLVIASDFFVDIRGHTDPSGTQAINDQISRQRAQFAKNYLLSKGVTLRRQQDPDDPASPLTNRFTDLQGVRDRFPPDASLGANPDNWRRVEIFMAKFPAGTTNPPASANVVNPVTPPAEATRLAQNGDPCEQLLVRTAWGASVP